jgi:hypothetical protein
MNERSQDLDAKFTLFFICDQGGGLPSTQRYSCVITTQLDFMYATVTVISTNEERRLC